MILVHTNSIVSPQSKYVLARLRSSHTDSWQTIFPDMPSLPPRYKPATNNAERKKATAAYHDANRPSASERGYDAKWAKIRIHHLQNHPLCEHCLKEGRYIQATLVDHIIPAIVRPDLFYSGDNYQSLCRQCHAIKTRDDIIRYAEYNQSSTRQAS